MFSAQVIRLISMPLCLLAAATMAVWSCTTTADAQLVQTKAPTTTAVPTFQSLLDSIPKEYVPDGDGNWDPITWTKVTRWISGNLVGKRCTVSTFLEDTELRQEDPVKKPDEWAVLFRLGTTQAIFQKIPTALQLVSQIGETRDVQVLGAPIKIKTDEKGARPWITKRDGHHRIVRVEGTIGNLEVQPLMESPKATRYRAAVEMTDIVIGPEKDPGILTLTVVKNEFRVLEQPDHLQKIEELEKDGPYRLVYIVKRDYPDQPESEQQAVVALHWHEDYYSDDDLAVAGGTEKPGPREVDEVKKKIGWKSSK